MCPRLLLLWDIDRTLVYTGHTDRLVYREAFAALVGRPARVLPAKGTGRTVPRAVEELLRVNGVPEAEVHGLAEEMVAQVPERQAAHLDHMRAHGYVLAGARRAVRAVADRPDVAAGVVTGNLRRSAELKLRAFALDGDVETAVGGYSSDDPHRPHLVAVAQRRAGERYGTVFTRDTTVIVGDSLEDVHTGVEGGARVVAVASGTTAAADLAAAGADSVLEDLRDVGALLDAVGAWIPGGFSA